MQGGWSIRVYDRSLMGEWDRFVREARNGTFLFERGYMDYHSDRFSDSSLMAYKNGRLLALLPADLSSEGVLRSHGGLTYGGWVTSAAHFDGGDMMALGESWAAWCRGRGIHTIDYKPLPWIFARYPAQEDIYLLSRMGGRPVEVNLSSTVDLRAPRGFNTLQRRHLRHGLAMNPEMRQTLRAADFWPMLEACLAGRHGAVPVHTAAEMQMLMDRFPENIHIHMCCLDGEPTAGVCIYDTGIVAHAQYIATTPRGRQTNMLASLFSFLMSGPYAGRRYFDFGTSNENHGRILNEGLLRQKNAYGASGTVFERWIVEL